MKKLIIIAICIMLIIAGAVLAINKGLPKPLPAMKTTNTTFMTLEVDVTQVPDICGVESPCAAIVFVEQNGSLLAPSQSYTGPGAYYFRVDDATTGWVTANVTNNYGSGVCTCVLYSTPDTETDPYPVFKVPIW